MVWIKKGIFHLLILEKKFFWCNSKNTYLNNISSFSSSGMSFVILSGGFLTSISSGFPDFFSGIFCTCTIKIKLCKTFFLVFLTFLLHILSTLPYDDFIAFWLADFDVINFIAFVLGQQCKVDKESNSNWLTR